MIRLIILVCVFQCSTLVGQKAVVNFSDVGISEERLAQVDEYIEENIQNGVIPGGTFYIARKGAVIYNKAHGKRNIETGLDQKRDDIFRLASMTKALTSVAILQLYEDGLLQLDDPVSKYLPEFKSMSVLKGFSEETQSFETEPAKQEITIRHLLTHTSGIYYGSFVDGIYKASYEKHGIAELGLYAPDLTTIEMARKIAKAPLMHEPGTQWTYGLNMDVLGAVVEIITKKKLSLIFLTEIFYPLGMHHSHFYLPQAKYSMLTPVYTYDDTGNLMIIKDDNMNYPIFLNKGHYAGGGGLSGTAAGYGKFLQALLNDGEYNGKRILNKSTVELMKSNQLADLNAKQKGMSKIPGLSFCLGSALITPEGKGISPHSPGTFSWSGYFNTKWWVDPKEELVFVGLTNILPFPHPEFWDKLYTIIYSSLEG